MEHEQLQEICEHLAVFPLPGTVFLPGSTLPLHVFEQRYRDLVTHCLAGNKMMGVATLKPGYEADYEGRPDLYPHVGVGQIVAHQPYPDGRSNIALRYVGRMTIERELSTDTTFRVVQGTALHDDADGAEAGLRSLKVLVLQLGGLSTEASQEARRLVQLEGMELVDALARRVLDDVDAQLAYLGANRLVDRIGMVQEQLARFMSPSSPIGEA